MVTKYDAIVIGGGPSGSTVATRLAQRGRRVVLLEKEHFPRFHIGESLLPCAMPLFEQLGVLPALEQHGFLVKYAAEFVTADGSSTRRYAFADGLIPGAPSAFEVDRAEFEIKKMPRRTNTIPRVQAWPNIRPHECPWR